MSSITILERAGSLDLLGTQRPVLWPSEPPIGSSAPRIHCSQNTCMTQPVFCSCILVKTINNPPLRDLHFVLLNFQRIVISLLEMSCLLPPHCGVLWALGKVIDLEGNICISMLEGDMLWRRDIYESMCA